MSVPYPYRAVICGQEHIVKSCGGGNLRTDRGEFVFRQLAGGHPLQTARILEVATLHMDENGQWLLNGHHLRSLETRRGGTRLGAIARAETLRVHRREIRGVVWLQVSDNGSTTQQLDEVLRFWETAGQPLKPNENSILASLEEMSANLLTFSLFKGWSHPLWLTEFQQIGVVVAEPTKEQLRLAKAAAELQQTKAELRKTQAAANDTLREALSKWLRFAPAGMKADTQARIEKAVKMYLTDPEKRSLKKIAEEFKVSRTTVSKWFAKFSHETGQAVVTHERHESVADHLKSDSENDPEENDVAAR